MMKLVSCKWKEGISQRLYLQQKQKMWWSLESDWKSQKIDIYDNNSASKEYEEKDRNCMKAWFPIIEKGLFLRKPSQLGGSANFLQPYQYKKSNP